MTAAKELKPTVRECVGKYGDKFVVEIRATTITIRPKGTRKGGKAEVDVGVGALYQRLLANPNAGRIK